MICRCETPPAIDCTGCRERDTVDEVTETETPALPARRTAPFVSSANIRALRPPAQYRHRRAHAVDQVRNAVQAFACCSGWRAASGPHEQHLGIIAEPVARAQRADQIDGAIQRPDLDVLIPAQICLGCGAEIRVVADVDPFSLALNLSLSGATRSFFPVATREGGAARLSRHLSMAVILPEDDKIKQAFAAFLFRHAEKPAATGAKHLLVRRIRDANLRVAVTNWLASARENQKYRASYITFCMPARDFAVPFPSARQSNATANGEAFAEVE